MRRLGLLTSGGDAPGMNAAIRAVVRKSIFHGMEVYGIKRGFSGLVNGEYDFMDVSSVADIIHRGGTVLKTGRCPEFLQKKVQQQAVKILTSLGVEGMVIIGGNGSFLGGHALQQAGISTICLPGTIDNDIPCNEVSIGFDTAINTVTHAVNNLRDTATSHERIYVVEVMGRDSGNIALMSGLASGAETIIMPEVSFDMQEICNRLMRGMERGKAHSIIMVAEGAASGIKVGEAIKEKTGMETRITVLGHLQRGGTPTAFDRNLASRMGALAVDYLREDRWGGAVIMFQGGLKLVDYGEVLSSDEYGQGFNREIFDLSRILSI